METESALGAQRGSYAGAPTGFRRLTPGLLKADRSAEGFDGLPEGVSVHGGQSVGCQLHTAKAERTVNLVCPLPRLAIFLSVYPLCICVSGHFERDRSTIV
jgi:hypothetical protein